MKRWCVLLVVAACANEPTEVNLEQAGTAWDPQPSVMPQWNCELPTPGAQVYSTGRTYATYEKVQEYLDAKCFSCHDGRLKAPMTNLAGVSRSRLYRWDANKGVDTAMFAAQIRQALRDDGDDRPRSGQFDGAMWNQVGWDFLTGPVPPPGDVLLPSERWAIYDHFAYCAQHPTNPTVAGLGPSNHYLTGRSYLPGINFVNTIGANTCLGDPSTCVVDEQGLATGGYATEMASFYFTSDNVQPVNTLGEWIVGRTPKFLRRPGESIDAFRDRMNIAVYYNEGELALGREMWCGTWPSGCNDDRRDGKPLCNLACGVTNYGISHNDVPNALATGITRRNVKNTVVISYNETLANAFGPGYAVQFAAFGPRGERLDKAQLDYQGGRPASYICTNCHGGWYDPAVHLVYEAKLLPANPHDVRYTDSATFAPSAVTIDSGGKYSRSTVQAKLQSINQLMYQWVQAQGDDDSLHFVSSPKDRSMLPAQLEWFEAMYCGGTPGCGPGFTFTNAAQHRAPKSWSQWNDGNCTDAQSVAIRAIYHHVIQPYCIGCHNAFIDEPYHYPAPAVVGSLESAADFGGANPMVTAKRFFLQFLHIEEFFIRNGRMPHAEHALKAFWTRAVTTDGTMAGDPLPIYECDGSVGNIYATKDGTRKGVKFTSPKELLYYYTLQSGVSSFGGTEPVPTTATECGVTHQMCGDPARSGRQCVNGACVDGCSATVHCPVPVNDPLNPNRTQCIANKCEPCGRPGQKICLNSSTTCNEGFNPGCSSAARCESTSHGVYELSQYSSIDTAHAYGDVNRCVSAIGFRDPLEVDRDIGYPNLVPTSHWSGDQEPVDNYGTPGFGANSTFPVPNNGVPTFASFTLAGTPGSSGTAAAWCTSNCRERAFDGDTTTYFDGSAVGGAFLDVDFGKNRTVNMIELSRESTSSTLLSNVNVYTLADNSSTWEPILAADGYGSGVYTINGYPSGLTVRVKVPTGRNVRKIRVRRNNPNCPSCSMQLRVAELKAYGY